MNTFLKVLLCLVLGIVAIKLPLLVLPVILVGLALLVVGILLGGGVAAVAGVGLAILTGLLVVTVVLVAALSPIWIPVLAIVGLIALIRRSGRVRA